MSSNSDAKHKIGLFLKEARREAQLSVEETAHYLELKSPQDILEFENGDKTVTLGQLYAFANIYNIGPDRLMSVLFELTSLEPGSALEDLERVLREAK